MLRRAIVASGWVPLCLAALACWGDRLSGPEARAAYARSRSHTRLTSDSVLLVIDGRRLEPGAPVPILDPNTIESVEILKGDAARQLYGDAARRGVVIVTTSAASHSTKRAGRTP